MAKRPKKPRPKPAPRRVKHFGTVGPDPVYGAGITLLGIVMMGIAGAATQHYAFNIGAGTAILGAVLCVAAIAITSLRQWQQKRLTASATAGGSDLSSERTVKRPAGPVT